MTKKTIQRASADVGFMMTAYNLRRLINIIGMDQFKEYLRMGLSLLLTLFSQKYLNKGFLKAYIFKARIHNAIFEPSIKPLYLTHNLILSGGF